jgi:hypothetical protein
VIIRNATLLCILDLSQRSSVDLSITNREYDGPLQRY